MKTIEKVIRLHTALIFFKEVVLGLFAKDIDSQKSSWKYQGQQFPKGCDLGLTDLYYFIIQDSKSNN